MQRKPQHTENHVVVWELRRGGAAAGDHEGEDVAASGVAQPEPQVAGEGSVWRAQHDGARYPFAGVRSELGAPKLLT